MFIPPNFGDYLKNKKAVKLKLQTHMRRLLAELTKPRMFEAFLDKSLFDGGNADYLSIFLGPSHERVETKVFHIFYKSDVVNVLSKDITPHNSKASHMGQVDDQKVTFKSALHGRNVGEIEDRHDSPGHYREMKCRLNAKGVFDILVNKINGEKWFRPQVVTHGKAIKTFKGASK